VTCKCGELLDTDNALAWEVAGPVFEAGIKQVAILNRIDDVRTEFYTRDDHLLALLLQGEMGIRTNDTTAWLKVADLACVPSGTPFVQTGKKNIVFSYVYITITDDERWNGLKQRGLWIRPYESADYLYLLVRRLLDAHAARDVVSIDHANRDSYALVDLLMRETRVTTKQDTATSLALKGLLNRIRANPGASWTNSQMASSLNMSERTFLRAFKQEFGTTPKTMVMKQRMMLARQRLKFTDDPVKQIARDLGYANRRTFSELFLTHVGVRPTEIRQRSVRDEFCP
jgi:AraC-like DNA-binding protein